MTEFNEQFYQKVTDRLIKKSRKGKTLLQRLTLMLRVVLMHKELLQFTKDYYKTIGEAKVIAIGGLCLILGITRSQLNSYVVNTLRGDTI